MVTVMENLGRNLDNQVDYYKSLSYAPNTKKAYSVHRKTYIQFCQALGEAPVPATTRLLCRYAVFLARKLKYNSIRQYLNIVRLLHAEWGLSNPCANNFHLNSTLRGIRRHMGDTVCRKAPIMPNHLLFRDGIPSLSSSYNISGLVPVCW